MSQRTSGSSAAAGDKRRREDDDEPAVDATNRRPRSAAAIAMASPSEQPRRGLDEDDDFGDDEPHVTTAHGAEDDTDADTDDSSLVPKRVSVNDLRQAGQVVRVYMENLRCHASLEVQLHPRVNFVTGMNGSGKSTILTAIRLALGWNPPMEVKGGPRARGWEAIISRGKDSTLVRVDFTNEGVDAVDAATYGRVVRIQRTITRSATGSVTNKYEVLNMDRGGSAGVSVAKELRAVTQLREGWGLDASNPVMIMDQEKSKSFLQGKATDQYDVFFQATLLKQNQEHLMDLVEQLDNMQASLTAKEKSMSELERQKREAVAEYTKHEEVIRLQAQVADAENDILWAHAHDKRRAAAAELQRAQQQLDAATASGAKIESMEKVLQGRQQELDAANERLAATANKLSELHQQLETLEPQTKETNQELARLRQQQLRAQDAVKSAVADVAKCQARLKQLKDEYAARDVMSERARRDQTIAEARLQVQEAREQLHKAQQEKLTTDAALSTADDDRAACQASMEATRAAHELAQARLENARSRAGGDSDPWQSLGASGADMKRVKQQIEEQFKRGALRVKPLDPLGMYVRADREWITAVQAVLKTKQQQFVFDNAQDAATVEREIAGRKIRATYLVKSSTRLLRDGMEPAFTTLPSMYSKIRIDNPWARSCVIDEADILQLAVAPSSDAARAAVVTDMRHMKSLPAGMKEVVLPDGRSVTARGSGITIRAADATAGAVALIRPLRNEDEIPMLIEICNRAKEAYENAAAALDAAAKSFAGLKLMQKSVDTTINRLHSQLNHAQTKLRQAEAMPEPQDDADEEDSAIAEAEALLTQANLRAETARNQLQSIEAALQGPMARQAQLLAEQHRLMDRLENDSELKAAQDDVDAKRTLVRDTGKKLQQGREMLQDKTRNCEAEVQQAQAKVQAAAELLEQVSRQTNMAAARDENLTEAEAKTYQRGIRASLDKTHTLSDDEIKRIRERKETLELAYEQERLRFEAVNVNFEKLKAEKKARVQQMRRNKETLGKRVCKEFRKLMKQKGYVAELEIEHRPNGKGSMNAKVIPDRGARYGDGYTQAGTEMALQDVATLSGGEKSISTLLLLAAVAAVCTVPFRIIDEFDVYQDEANRKFSMQMLLDLARRPDSQGRHMQYILLTPHDISSVVRPIPGELDVIRLKKPVRDAAAAAQDAMSEADE